MKLEHKGGDQSEIQLSDIKLGEPLKDELFKFVPPPNAEEVRESAGAIGVLPRELSVVNTKEIAK